MSDAVSRAAEMGDRYEQSLANQRTIIDGMQRKLIEIERIAVKATTDAATSDKQHVERMGKALADIIGVKRGTIPS